MNLSKFYYIINVFVLLLLINPKVHAEQPAFWWGVGHAAFQVEGEPGDSDWKEWTLNPKNISDGTNADLGTGFWKSPDEDFNLAQQLGANMFRMSIAWERVQPAPDQFNEEALDHYEKIILNLRKHNMEPLVTLYHFVLPNWLAKEGGLLSARFVEYFSNYQLHVVRRLANGPAKVRWWMTINEPLVPIVTGYILGIWPPGKKSISEALKAHDSLVAAQNQTMKVIREDKSLPSDLKFSVAYNWRDVQATGFGPFNFIFRKMVHWLVNDRFLSSISASKNLDYLGINYYGRYVVHPTWKPPFITIDEGDGDKTDLGWTIYPEGLGHSIEKAYETYQLPILISENGIADANDTKRTDFLRSHILEIKKAREKNIPVIGYLHWSLTDNFEWSEGLKARFGLVEMDYTNLKRIPRKSFEVYKEIIENFKKEQF